jgi:soluble lytic murein transglycosylase-like protein
MCELKIGWIRVVAKVSVLSVLVVFPLVQFAAAESVVEYSEHCAAAYASAFGVPVELVDAIIQVESDWNPYALSSKGAEGLMQIMPLTAARFGVRNRFSIDENIRAGVAYLAWLIRLFRGDLRLAVAAYQVGESPILARGLAYSAPDVFNYVTHVAQLYRVMCHQNAGRPAPAENPTVRGSEQ